MDEFEQTKCLAFFYAKRRFKSFEDKRLGILLCFSYRQAADGRTINFVPMFIPISSRIQLLPWRVKRLGELWQSECPDKKRSLNSVNLEFQVTFTLPLKRQKRKHWRFKYHGTHSNHWKAKKHMRHRSFRVRQRSCWRKKFKQFRLLVLEFASRLNVKSRANKWSPKRGLFAILERHFTCAVRSPAFVIVSCAGTVGACVCIYVRIRLTASTVQNTRSLFLSSNGTNRSNKCSHAKLSIYKASIFIRSFCTCFTTTC